jgi:hypothetical protein
MRYLFLFGLIAILFTSACKKQEEITIDKGGLASFTPMSVGSYWIYDVSNVDSTGQATFISYDSTYIVSDTILNGNTYFVYNSSSSPFFIQMLRDSAMYLVDENGQKFFHPENFVDTLYKNVIPGFNNDTINFTYRLMRKPNKPTLCIAGTFNTLDAEVTRYLPFFNLTSKSHYHYTPGIGLVLRQDFPIFGNVRTYNLVRYHIE